MDARFRIVQVIFCKLDGIQEEQGFGSIMSELERVYSASRTSGGTRDAVTKALEELCAKGILEREQKANQWVYRESAGFKERVRKA